MNKIKLLQKLFNKTSKSLSGGGLSGGFSGGNMNDSETSALLKLVVVVIILFFVYTYYENSNKKYMNGIENNSNQNTIYQPYNQNDSKMNQNNNNNQDDLKMNQNNNNNNNDDDLKMNQNNQMEIIRPPPSVGFGQDLYGVLRNYDYKTYNDPLTPPFKRDDYMIPAHVVDPDRYGIYTRGGPTAFKKMGYLNNSNAVAGDAYKFLTLMGRQKYYNSTQYEYYVVSTNRDENIKFDLDKKRELFTGDTVKVPQLNNVDYDVTIDKNLDYEYSPYIV